MSPSFSWTFFMLVSLLPSSQAEDTQKTNASDHDKHQEPPRCQQVSLTIANFSFAMLREALHWPKHTNILLSPTSIAAAFTMLSLGTKGDTHKEIMEGLGLNFRDMPEAEIHRCFYLLLRALHQPDHQPQLTTGSSLFINQSLSLADKFVQEVQELYQSDIIAINFRDKGVKKQINDHVEKKIEREIPESVKVLQKDSALALVNYISFRGCQNDEFEDERTVKEEFHVHRKKVVMVLMVNRLGRFYLHQDRSLSSWVLVQHYVGDAIAFFILPDLGKMQQLEQSLSHEHLNNIQKHIDLRFANLYFPKLSISETYDLNMVLSPLGITEIFSSKANLTGVTEHAPLKLSKAVHQAVLGIENEDIEPPVVTHIHEDSSWPKVFTITFNRPFLVVIKDEFINVPYLMGRVGNPKQ